MPRDRRFVYDDPAHDIRDPTTWDVVATHATVVDASGSTDTSGVRAFEPTEQTGYGWAYAAELQFDSAVASSSLTWATEPAGRESELLVETSLDQGGSWTEATRGGAIPGVSPGQGYSGKTLIVRCTFLDGLTSPHLGSITTTITWENDSDGNPQTYSRTETLTADLAAGTLRGVRAISNRLEVAADVVARFAGSQWLRVHGLTPSQSIDASAEIGTASNRRLAYALDSEVPPKAIFWGWRTPDYQWERGAKQRLAQAVTRRLACSVEVWVTPDTRPDTPPFSETGEAVVADSKPDIAAGVLWCWEGASDDDGMTLELRNREEVGSVKRYNGVRVYFGGAVLADVYTSSAGVLGIGGDLFEPGRTYHLAVVYDGLTCTVYVDGRPVAAQAALSNTLIAVVNAEGTFVGNVDLRKALGVPMDTQRNLYIGRRARTPHDGFRGTMTEFRVWDVGLNPSEVLARSTRRLTTAELNTLATAGDLLAYFPLNAPSWTDEAGQYSGANGGVGYPPAPDSQASAPTTTTVASLTGRQFVRQGRNVRAQYRLSPPVSLTKLGRTVRAATTPFDVVIDGATFKGVSHLGGVEAIRENSRQQATQVQLSLNAVVPEYVGLSLGEHWADRPGSIYWLAFGADGAPLGAVLIFRGRMDQMPVKIGRLATLSVVLESELVSWEAPHQRRMNDQSQQAWFPGDKGCEFISVLVDKDAWWPGRLQDELDV